MENLESIHSIQSVVLVIHLILALAIIGLVLIQRSEGGGLGIGSSGGLGGFASARGTANMLTRLTAIFACGFFITSLSLGVLAAKQSSASRGILETVAPAALEKVEAAQPKDTGIAFEPPTAAENGATPKVETQETPAVEAQSAESEKPAETKNETQEPSDSSVDKSIALPAKDKEPVKPEGETGAAQSTTGTQKD